MHKLLIPLLAALALPTAVNATNYVECEAISEAMGAMLRISSGYKIEESEKIWKE